MELEFQARFSKQLDFQQIEFFIETRYLENRVSNKGISLNNFRQRYFVGKF